MRLRIAKKIFVTMREDFEYPVPKRNLQTCINAHNKVMKVLKNRQSRLLNGRQPETWALSIDQVIYPAAYDWVSDLYPGWEQR